MLVINFRNLLRDIWKNNPENFERKKSPNIQFPQAKSPFPTMLISQSAFYAQKKITLAMILFQGKVDTNYLNGVNSLVSLFQKLT